MGRRGRPPCPDILTPREWEVLALLREGFTNEAIAERLGITHAGAKFHVSQILSRLGVATREEAAAWQPEAERRPWWAAALAWLRPITLGKAALITAAVAVLAGLGVLAWGVFRDSNEAPASVVSGSTTPTSSAPIPASGGPLAAAPPYARPDGTILFARGWSRFDDLGVIWSANADGSDARPISDAHRIAASAGVAPDPATGNSTLYFLTQDAGQTDLWGLDLETGNENPMLSFASSTFGLGASVSADGRRIAYMYRGGIALLDVATGVTQHLIGGGADDAMCSALSGLFDCASFERPGWSPDGRYLMVIQAFGEHGRLILLDPSTEPVSEVTRVEVCCSFDWAPNAARYCAWGRYLFPSALYVASPPEWQPSKFFSEYENDEISFEGPAVTGCKWLDDETVLVRIIQTSSDDPSRQQVEMLELNAGDGSTRTVTRYSDDGAMWLDNLPPVQAGILFQNHYASYRHRAPEVLDPRTGERGSILTDEDTVLAVIPPQ